MSESANLDYAHNRLMAALGGLRVGKTRDDTVAVRPFGRETTIFAALNDAAILKEPFHAEQMETVNQALQAVGITCASDQKNEVATALLAALIRKSQ